MTVWQWANKNKKYKTGPWQWMTQMELIDFSIFPLKSCFWLFKYSLILILFWGLGLCKTSSLRPCLEKDLPWVKSLLPITSNRVRHWLLLCKTLQRLISHNIILLPLSNTIYNTAAIDNYKVTDTVQRLQPQK